MCRGFLRFRGLQAYGIPLALTVESAYNKHKHKSGASVIKQKQKTKLAQQLSVALRTVAVGAVILQSSLSLLLPTFASASAQLGNGTPTNPYQITDCSQLANTGSKPAANYQLTTDLTCSTGWSSPTFGGTLDGRNHTISGLATALFSSLTGTVKNLTLSNTTVTGQGQVGAVADQADGATITSITASGTISGQNVVGGLIGQTSNGTAISRSSFTGTVSGSGTLGAGLVADLADTNIRDSFANATVRGFDQAAGLVAKMTTSSSKTSTLSNLYAVGEIDSANGKTAGLVEQVAGDGSSIINNSFVVTSSPQGALLPFGIDVNSTTITQNVVFDATVSGTTDCGGAVTTGCTAANTDGTDPSHFKNTRSVAPLSTNWNFNSVWNQTSDYPTLQPATLVTATTPSTVHAKSDTTYSVNTCQDLQNIANDPTGTYNLTQDIDCSMTNPASGNFDPEGPWADGTGFQPIDNFLGTLNGNSHTVDGLYFNQPDNGGIAMIYEIMDGSSVQDLTITNETITAYYDCGGLVAYSDPGSEVDNVNVTSQLNCSYGAGGISSDVESGVGGTITISNSTATTGYASSYDASANDWGGIVAYVSMGPGTLNLIKDQTNVTINSETAQCNSQMGR